MSAFETMVKNKNKIFNILFLLFSLFVAGQIYGKQLKRRDLLVERKDLESKKNVILDGISNTDKRIESYKSLLERDDPSKVISIVSNIANQTEVKIISIKPDQQQRLSEYVKIPYRMELITASYHNLGYFLSRLESHGSVFMVDAIEVRKEGLSKDLKVTLTASLITNK